MGWGQGIGIGWPNATSSQGEMVYFLIDGVCGQVVPPNSTTQLVDSSFYQTGDYVRYDGSGGNRVLLGAITEEVGSMVFNIGLPIYTSCPI
jgi:hypothetical protein